MWCSTGFYPWPFTFLLYINDIHLSSSLLKSILFADDTNVLFSNADFNMLQDLLNSELKKVSNRPIRLTQCCTQFKSPGVKILYVLYLHYNVAFTFK